MLVAGGRPYKSRKARPCDLCRGRKTACHMEHGPPCQFCRERKLSCTFLRAPEKRRRLAARSAQGSVFAQDHALDHSVETRHLTYHGDVIEQSDDGPPFEDPFHDPLAGGGSLLLNGEPCQPSPQTSDYQGLVSRSINYLDESLDMLLARTPAVLPALLRSAGEEDGLPTPMRSDEQDEGSSPSTNTPRSPAEAGVNSLEARQDSTYRAVGSTGDLDLFVLNQRDYDESSESAVQYRGLFYRRMYEADAATDTFPPVFTVVQNDLVQQSQPRLLDRDLNEASEGIRSIISNKLAYRLTMLYAHYVHPNFPILSARQFPESPEKVPEMPLSLLAAVCATAIPFITYDDVLSVWLPQCPSKDELFRFAWILITQELHGPRLSTIQACLLLVQDHVSGTYVPNTPFKSTLLATTVTLCHSLALHRDSSEWHSLPAWERRLRKRIWWATWMTEKWNALGEAIPSSLKEDESSVPPLTSEDLVDDVPRHLDTLRTSPQFLHLISLTVILDDVVASFFTVKASKQTEASLDASLEAARPLRAKLKHWHESLPQDLKNSVLLHSNEHANVHRANGESASATLWSLDSRGSFYLAYLTVQLTLFRALLRPLCHLSKIQQPSDASPTSFSDLAPLQEHLTGPKAVVKGALTLISEVVSFAESLNGAEWDAFWHSWSRTNFAVVSSVMLNLMMLLDPHSRSRRGNRGTATDNGDDNPGAHSSPGVEFFNEYRTLLDYLTRWRWAMKVASRGAGGRKGLMNLSLLRMDALLAELCASSGAERNGSHGDRSIL